MKHKDFEMTSYFGYGGKIVDVPPYNKEALIATVTTAEALLSDGETIGYATLVAVWNFDSLDALDGMPTILRGEFEGESVTREEAVGTHLRIACEVRKLLQERRPLIREEVVMPYEQTDE